MNFVHYGTIIKIQSKLKKDSVTTELSPIPTTCYALCFTAFNENGVTTKVMHVEHRCGLFCVEDGTIIMGLFVKPINCY